MTTQPGAGSEASSSSLEMYSGADMKCFQIGAKVTARSGAVQIEKKMVGEAEVTGAFAKRGRE